MNEILELKVENRRVGIENRFHRVAQNIFNDCQYVFVVVCIKTMNTTLISLPSFQTAIDKQKHGNTEKSINQQFLFAYL